jgi:hypothetical protein
MRLLKGNIMSSKKSGGIPIGMPAVVPPAPALLVLELVLL